MPWWQPQLAPALSQGDLLAEVVFSVAVHPLAPLRKASLKGQQVWEPSDWVPDASGAASVLALGRKGPALVVSHSCDLDKPRAKGRVLVCPAPLLDGLQPEHRELVVAQKRRDMIPLPGLSDGDHYADLKIILAVDRRTVDDTVERVASMTPEGQHRLRLGLIAFFTRADGTDLLIPPD